VADWRWACGGRCQTPAFGRGSGSRRRQRPRSTLRIDQKSAHTQPIMLDRYRLRAPLASPPRVHDVIDPWPNGPTSHRRSKLAEKGREPLRLRSKEVEALPITRATTLLIAGAEPDPPTREADHRRLAGGALEPLPSLRFGVSMIADLTRNAPGAAVKAAGWPSCGASTGYPRRGRGG
jgi:hypothetical protein